MDLFTSIAIALGIESRRQKKEEDRRTSELAFHQKEIKSALIDLNSIFDDLFEACSLSMKEDDLSSAEELIPLYPMAEILSLQGDIGREQAVFLRDYLNAVQSRYNLDQFTTAAIRRCGIYPEWKSLTALEEENCGQVWHTLIEAICRLRRPASMQSVIDALGAILYHFWLLDNSDMEQPKVRYGQIIERLNFHAARDQQLPYLHAVMVLQMELAAICGGTAVEYDPALDAQSIDMDGRPGDCFWVRKREDHKFYRRFAVRQCKAPGRDPDLIWELLPSGKHTVFFTE